MSDSSPLVPAGFGFVLAYSISWPCYLGRWKCSVESFPPNMPLQVSDFLSFISYYGMLDMGFVSFNFSWEKCVNTSKFELYENF